MPQNLLLQSKNIKFVIMKRLSIIIFVLCLCSLASYADERDIPIQSVDANTRSISVLPEATIGNGIIFISFDASGVYSLYIEDSISSIQDRNNYSSYIYVDDSGLIRRELKYCLTPVVFLLDSSKIIKTYFPKNQYDRQAQHDFIEEIKNFYE